MKKLTLTAIAVASAFAASANAAEVYNADNVALNVGGRVEARTTLTDTGDNKQDDASRARLNVDAKTNVTDSVFAHGFFEKEFTKANSNDTRYLYVGVGNENNELQYGKTDGSLGLLTDYTDVLNFFGAEASSKSATADRADNQFLYIGTYGGLTVKANYNGGGSKIQDDNKNDVTIDQGYGASASYDFGQFKLGAGYANETHEDNGAQKVKDSDNILVGAGVDLTDALYFGALYVNGSQLGNDFQGYELATTFAATDKLSLGATFTSARFDDIRTGDTEKDSHKAALSATYQFTNYFSTYAEASKEFTNKEQFGGVLGAKVTF
ncbi:outer membrane protein ompU [Vibrio sp. JCM 19236]|nr:outer membrane protein ompU [Vibrio sp. JCM 19236]